MRKLVSIFASVALAFGLCPAFSAPAYADAEGEGEAAASTLEEGTYVEGEALVLYHAEPAEEAASQATAQASLADANDGSAVGAVSDDAAEIPGTGAFALQGFTVVDGWDVSAPDDGVALASVDEEGASDAQANDDDADLRIAQVSTDGASTADMIAQLQALDYVVVAEPNQIYTVDATTPDDTYYSWQSAALTDDDSSVNLDAAIAADPDWEIAATKDGESIVAVIDTGVDFNNPDLANMAWQNPGDIGLEGAHGYDFGSGDDDPTPNADGNEEDSHGTHCAGIIAAQANNAQGIAGSGQSTRIMALKVAASGGGGSMLSAATCGAYEYVIKALAAGQNVVAISNSWGGGSYSAILDYLVNQAGKLGALSFFAAGNESLDIGEAGAYGNTDGLESPYGVVVASTNRYNQLSSFSNHNVTEVDVAAPGSNILSTVATDEAASGLFWNALLVKQAKGEDALSYYDDFSTFGASSSGYVWDLAVPYAEDGQTKSMVIDSATATAEDLVSFETNGISLEGEPALRVTLDGDALQTYMRSEGGDPTWSVNTYLGSVGINIVKNAVSNPFKGLGLTSLSDYRISSWADVEGANAVTAFLSTNVVRVYDADGKYSALTDMSCFSQSTCDNYLVQGGFLSDLDADALARLNGGDTLTVGVVLQFATIDGTAPASADGSTHKLTGTVTGFGFGKKSTCEPYTLMSGTSMATPMLAGCYAELAKLYPDESALERRGRVVGSTVATESASYSEGWQTATDGRFSFDAGALDDDGSDISGNTWSAEADTAASTVTLYGRALSDVSVVGDDGAELAVDSRAEDGSWVKVRVGAALFDGGYHRFDVTDASTGKTHKASYEMPSAASQEVGSELTKVADLPEQTAAYGNGAAVSTPVGMAYLDTKGTYAYLCANPAAADASWQQLAAPGLPWAEHSEYSFRRTAISYGYAEGTLYAVCCDDDGSGGVAVWASTFDLAAGTSGTWSAYKRIGSYTSTAAEGETATVAAGSGYIACADGVVYCLCQISETVESTDANGTATSTTTNHYLFLNAAAGTADFSSHTYATSGDMFGASVVGLVGGSRLSAVALFSEEDGESSPTAFGSLSYNVADGTWSKEGLEGSPTFGSTVSGDAEGFVTGSTGTGGVVAGKFMGNSGDLLLCDRDAATAESLGAYGLLTSEGYVVKSLQVLDGTLYVCALDARTQANGGDSSSLGALYALPASAQAKIASTDAAAVATATQGGSATVADWRGGTQASQQVRMGDKATWTAVASEGYTFVGWYDAAGELVSTDATYSQVMTGEYTLEARFKQTSGGGSGGGAGGGVSGGGGTAGSGGGSGAATKTAQTGDGTGALALLAFGALMAAGATAGRARKICVAP